jgi:hypothetical protein
MIPIYWSKPRFFVNTCSLSIICCFQYLYSQLQQWQKVEKMCEKRFGKKQKSKQERKSSIFHESPNKNKAHVHSNVLCHVSCFILNRKHRNHTLKDCFAVQKVKYYFIRSLIIIVATLSMSFHNYNMCTLTSFITYLVLS